MNCANCTSSVYLRRIEYFFITIINVCPLVSILPETILLTRLDKLSSNKNFAIAIFLVASTAICHFNWL